MTAFSTLNPRQFGSADPAAKLVAITPSDSVDLTNSVRQLYVGVGGDVVVIDHDSQSVMTFKNVPSGGTIGPFLVSRVNSTNTTATNMIGFV